MFVCMLACMYVCSEWVLSSWCSFPVDHCWGICHRHLPPSDVPHCFLFHTYSILWSSYHVQQAFCMQAAATRGLLAKCSHRLQRLSILSPHYKRWSVFPRLSSSSALNTLTTSYFYAPLFLNAPWGQIKWSEFKILNYFKNKTNDKWTLRSFSNQHPKISLHRKRK